MDNLILKGTSRTPEVEFHIEGNLSIKGRSIPEDAGLFYNTLYSWIFQYCMAPQSQTFVLLDLEYMNSGSSKSILQILRELTGIAQNGMHLEIKWLYEIGDEDMLEKGEYFESILNHKFEFIETY
jgi:hypothetical protein